jgi:subtilisin family serine protease
VLRRRAPSALAALAILVTLGATDAATAAERLDPDAVIGALSVHPAPPPDSPLWRITHNSNAADTTNADQLWSGGGLGYDLTGSGVTVGVWDEGTIRDTHVEFVTPGGTSRVVVVDTANTRSHATHVGGTIGAEGEDSGARGMANEVILRSRNWTNDFTTSGGGEMADDAAAGLIDITNHSYGQVRGWRTKDWEGDVGNADTWYGDRALFDTEDPGFGRYGSQARGLDAFLHDHPQVLSVWSAGNDRNDSFGNVTGDQTYVAYFSTPPSPGTQVEGNWYLVSTADYPAPPKDGGSSGFDTLPDTQVAKNSLTIGAIHDYTTDPHGTGINVLSFSSFGPTDDGRVKPDLVGNGASLRSTDSGNDTDYGTKSGTSMAAPNVAGTAALLLEHWRDTRGDSPPAATQKGLLIHTATDAGNTGPDYSFGWGLPDAAEAATFITDAVTDPIATRQRHVFEGTVTTGGELSWLFTAVGGAIKATLVWTDPEGTTKSGLDNTDPALVNDLDIWLTDESDVSYMPWSLDPANPDVPAVRTLPNRVDNVEQVFVDSAGAGEVIELHLGAFGTLLDDLQDFSLLVDGLVLVPEPYGAVALLLTGVLLVVLRPRRPA